MKSLLKILLATALFSTFLFPGCKKFLDTPPQGSLTQEDFPVTAPDALLATNACYFLW